jgi:hypothetical protein
MAALTADRDTKERAVPQATRHERLAASSKTFYVGQLVGIDTNVAGSPVTPAVGGDLTLQICGRCEQNLVTGANNTKTVKFKSGCFYYASGPSLEVVDADDIGEVVYVVDDQTVGLVGLTAGATAAGIPVNTPAGRVYDVDQYGVAVFIEWPAPPLAPIGPTGV